MAKRTNSGKRNSVAASPLPDGSGIAGDALEQRVVAFAEQLGRIVGTVQAKTEGWMDREALNRQIVSVRDGASELLEQLKTTVSKAAPAVKTTTPGAKAAARKPAPAPATSRGRSGGVVDAPGKKHRKPSPRDSRALAADAVASRARSGRPSMKPTKQRGRG